MNRLLCIVMTWGLLIVSCTSNSQADRSQTLNVGDSITTIDSVNYYWLQIAEDSAYISAVKDGEIINKCLVTGPVYGAVPAEDDLYSNRFLFIVCGEDQYQLFDTENMPNEVNYMTEEEWENYNVEDENADTIICL